MDHQGKSVDKKQFLKDNFLSIAGTLYCIVVLALIFVTRQTYFIPLYLWLPLMLASVVLCINCLRNKMKLLRLLPFMVAVLGVFLFQLLLGLSGMISTLLFLLSFTVVFAGFFMLFKFGSQVLLQRVVGAVLSVALLLLSGYFLLQGNLRVKPNVTSLQSGHDLYLERIRNNAYSMQKNVVVILMDDMGYGDLSLYTDSPIKTPNLERLADSGVVMDQFYASNPVCSPSRFGCLTGRYAVRGNDEGTTAVYFPTVVTGSAQKNIIQRNSNAAQLPDGVDGMLGDEITVAEVLQASGYKTGAFGKWHLGDYGQYLPNSQGFDYFYGAHYSNDMAPYAFYKNHEIDIPAPVDQTKINSILTSEVVSFIGENSADPFFVYYASPWPHFPTVAGGEYQGASDAGSYGDCIEEFDAGLGEIIDKLEQEGVLDDTLIIFTSDNGPWFEGSTGGLRGRKGNMFNGGQMVPFIAAHPSLAQGETLSTRAMNIDLFPTILEFCGISEMPTDRIIDGRSILPLLTGETSALSRPLFFTTPTGQIQGVAQDEFKYFVSVPSDNANYKSRQLKQFLFNLALDPREAYNVRDLHPDIAQAMDTQIKAFNAEIKENARGILRPTAPAEAGQPPVKEG